MLLVKWATFLEQATIGLNLLLESFFLLNGFALRLGCLLLLLGDIGDR